MRQENHEPTGTVHAGKEAKSW